MTRLFTTLALALVLLLAACGQATPATSTATPDDVAREFVTALGSWDELTLRRLAIPNGLLTESMIESSRGTWPEWVNGSMGPQTGVEIAESTADATRAIIVVRSLHAQGESRVRLVLLKVDGVWKVETWNSYLP
jgi:type IV pilus biogenesis protein CpaD/CtpE